MSEHGVDIGRLAGEALDLMVAAVRGIPASGWDLPSNLDGWSVRDLVAHATGSATKVVALLEGGELWDGPSNPADWTRDDPAAVLTELTGRLRAALPHADLEAIRASPQGDAPIRRALAFPVCDLALHSWDLHRSLGTVVELPEDLLDLSDGLVTSVPEEMLRRPGSFGAEQPAPPGCSRTARLMAFLGRSI